MPCAMIAMVHSALALRLAELTEASRVFGSGLPRPWVLFRGSVLVRSRARSARPTQPQPRPGGLEIERARGTLAVPLAFPLAVGPELGQQHLLARRVELLEGAVGRLNDREQPLLIGAHVAVGVANIEESARLSRVEIERLHDDSPERATAAQEGEHLQDAPEAVGVRAAGKDDKVLRRQKEDGQRPEARVDVPRLVDARL